MPFTAHARLPRVELSGGDNSIPFVPEPPYAGGHPRLAGPHDTPFSRSVQSCPGGVPPLTLFSGGPVRLEPRECMSVRRPYTCRREATRPIRSQPVATGTR